MNILKLTDLYDLHLLQFMYNFVNANLSASLLNIFEYQRDIHEHLTRHSNDPRGPNSKSETMNRSFMCKGPKLWTELVSDLKNSQTKRIFKKRMKRFIIDNY
jgi:hypothetical protein